MGATKQNEQPMTA
jgi:hypothetical protein